MSLARQPSRSDLDHRSVDDLSGIAIELPNGLNLSQLSRDELYNMKVLTLTFGQTEDNVDQHLVRTALGLNLNVGPPARSRTQTLDIVGNNVNSIAISPSPPERSTTESRNSESTHPTSCGSSLEHHAATKASSVSTASILSAPASIMSEETTVKERRGLFRQGFRRLSTFRKRHGKNTSLNSPASTRLGSHAEIPRHSTSRAEVSRPSTSHRPSTADPTRRRSPESRHVDGPNKARGPPKRSSPRPPPPPFPPRTFSNPDTAAYEGIRHISPLPGPIHARPQTIAVEPSDSGVTFHELEGAAAELCIDDIQARERSKQNLQLGRLRVRQVDEQGRFIRFEREQCQSMLSKRGDGRRKIRARYEEQESGMRERQAEDLVAVENRHLAAEVELVRTLNLERKACDTRLKHMEAYCNGHNPDTGMPARKVTEEDYKKLVQQYHLRSSMDNLHEARVNVLRERQAKQLERIAAKQELAIEAYYEGMKKELEQYGAQCDDEDADMRQEFMDRRKRLVYRWTLAEAIERRKLEIERGEIFGPLPEIQWPRENTRDPLDIGFANGFQSPRPNTPMSEFGPGSSSSRAGTPSTFGGGGGVAIYDAVTMNMI
ncbi:hypothetical protein MMC09_003032 [Bachmanniomyces sp. S44760]|nr:hypothetical protein [Bachmanniomyces sp. S44760]